jgi:pimeloyl-ACP methyl ester carboxylesterase
MNEISGILTRGNGATIAYRRSPGKNPGVLFVHGLRSDMNGSKALALEAHCRADSRAFLRFDLSGHGASSGDFSDGTIGTWAADLLEVLDRLTLGRQILVGSSLGGWLMLLAALARPGRVAALLGLAAAPDFTADLLWSGLSPDQRHTLEESGRVLIDDCYGAAPYPITRLLIEEGRTHLLLTGPIEIGCRVTLIQGQADPDVPWQTALRLAERLQSDQVQVHLLKSAGHRLSEPDNLRSILRSLDALVHDCTFDRVRSTD